MSSSTHFSYIGSNLGSLGEYWLVRGNQLQALETEVVHATLELQDRRLNVPKRVDSGLPDKPIGKLGDLFGYIGVGHKVSMLARVLRMERCAAQIRSLDDADVDSGLIQLVHDHLTVRRVVLGVSERCVELIHPPLRYVLGYLPQMEMSIDRHHVTSPFRHSSPSNPELPAVSSPRFRSQSTLAKEQPQAAERVKGRAVPAALSCPAKADRCDGWTVRLDPATNSPAGRPAGELGLYVASCSAARRCLHSGPRRFRAVD